MYSYEHATTRAHALTLVFTPPPPPSTTAVWPSESLTRLEHRIQSDRKRKNRNHNNFYSFTIVPALLPVYHRRSSQIELGKPVPIDNLGLRPHYNPPPNPLNAIAQSRKDKKVGSRRVLRCPLVIKKGNHQKTLPIRNCKQQK